MRFECGPTDGSAPAAEAVPQKSVKLAELETDLLQLEQQLASVAFENPEGDISIHRANYEKWQKAFKPLLVDWGTAKIITGGLY